MRIVTLFGSPRPEGNTSTILSWVEGDLRQMGHEVERIDVPNLNIGGCVECQRCQFETDIIGCPRSDEVNNVLTKVIESDAFVIASPLFCWGFSGQIKPLLDRFYSLVKQFGRDEPLSLIEKKPVALIVTCAGPFEDNAELIIRPYEHFAEYTRSDNRGWIVATGCTDPHNIDEKYRKQADELAEKLGEG